MRSRATVVFLCWSLLLLVGCSGRTETRKEGPIWSHDGTAGLYAENDWKIPASDLIFPDRPTEGRIVRHDPRTGERQVLVREADRNITNVQTTSDGSLYYLSEDRRIRLTREGLGPHYKSELKRLSPDGKVTVLSGLNGMVSPAGDYLVVHDPGTVPHALRLLDRNGTEVRNVGSPIANIPWMGANQVKWSTDGRKILYPAPYLVSGSTGEPPPPETDPNGKIYEYDLAAGTWAESPMTPEQFRNHQNPATSVVNRDGRKILWKYEKNPDGTMSQTLVEEAVQAAAPATGPEDSALQTAFREFQAAQERYLEATRQGGNPEAVKTLLDDLLLKKSRYQSLLGRPQ